MIHRNGIQENRKKGKKAKGKSRKLEGNKEQERIDDKESKKQTLVKDSRPGENFIEVLRQRKEIQVSQKILIMRTKMYSKSSWYFNCKTI